MAAVVRESFDWSLTRRSIPMTSPYVRAARIRPVGPRVPVLGRPAELRSILPALMAALDGAGLSLPSSLGALADQATGPQAGDGQAAERIAGELAGELATHLADHPTDHHPDATTGVPPGALLVLDEADSLPAGSPGLQLIDALLRQLPPGLQVAFAAREAMPLDLAGLRGRGELHELDATALRMSHTESSAILTGLLGDASVVLHDRIHDLTGGWPGAIRLIALSLRDLDPEGWPHQLANLDSGHSGVVGYVATAVLDRLPAALNGALHTIADLGSVDEPVGDRLGLPHGALQILSTRGLLDGPDASGGFALTPIVAMALAHATRPSGPHMQERGRVLQVYVDLDRPQQALTTALAWRDVDAAARLLEDHGPTMLARGSMASLTAAAEVVPHERRSAAVEELLGQALMIAGDWTGALQCLHRAARGTDPLPVRVAWRLGLIHYLRGETAAALAVYDAAADADADDYQAALLLAFEACARWVGGQLDAARAVASRALRVAQQFGDPHALSAVHTALAMVASADGDRVGSERHFADGLACARSAGDILQEVRLRSNHASHLAEEGRYHDALEELDMAGHLADLTGFAVMRLLIGTNRADVRRRLGDLDAAEADAREAEELGRTLGTGLVQHPQLVQAEIHRDRGDIEHALRIYSYVMTRAQEARDHQVEVPALAGAARVTSDASAARALAVQAVERSDGMWRLPARLALGWIELRTGGLESSATHARWVLDQARRSRSVVLEAEALELLAAAGPIGDRTSTLEAAMRLWAYLGAVLDELRVRAALGVLQQPDAARSLPQTSGVRIGRGVSRRVVEVAGLDQAAAGWAVSSPDGATVVKVTIRTFGGFSISRPDGEVLTSEWRSRKARDLLRMLVARRGAHTSRTVLAEMLWPGEDIEKVANRLSAAMSVVRSILDPDKVHPPDRYVSATSSAIWLRLQHLDIDLERFHVGLTQARGAASEAGAEAALDAATRLYTGEFMADEPFEDWTLPTREDARAGYLQALRTLVQMASAIGDHDAAIRRSLRLLAEDPYDEEAYGQLIGICTTAGHHGEAQRHYRRYVAQMRRLGVTPMPFPGVARLRGIA
ncbi:BTAD domain-containing putative transcriptional regulator [soil metagenome]